MTSLGPPQASGSPLPGSTPPEPSRSGRVCRGGTSAPLGSLTEGQQDAAEAQHPQGPHGVRPVSLKSLSIAGAASTPTPKLGSSHLQPRGPPTTPQAGRAAFHPHFSRAGDGKHEPTNRAAPRTHGTQWGFVGGTEVHQSELSRCGDRCPKRGSFRLVRVCSFSPIKWLRGPLTRGTAPLPGRLWPLRATVQ